MTRRIFRSICAVTITIFLAALFVISGVMYHYFTHMQKSQLRMQTFLAAQGVSQNGIEFFSGNGYFEGKEVGHYRITWIDSQGNVLYDSKLDADSMENHAVREEISEAMQDGEGESERYSASLMEHYLYCAKQLPDNSILRLSISQESVFSLLWGMLRWVIVILVGATVLSFVLALWLSKKIVQPLNDINLDDPLSNNGYDEISSLLQRIDSQQKKLKQQEIELQKKRDELFTVTENMSEGLILLNDNGIILSINPAAKHWLGDDQDCIGQNLLLINPSSQIQKLLKRALDGRQCEVLLELSQGLYQLDASPVISEERISGAVILIFDITEKRNVEKMRREFTANVSHELKTPLHSISGYAELLCNGMVREADVGQFAKKIYIEAQRMIHLVEDILRLSHLDEENDSLKWERADLYQLVSEAVHSFEKVAARQNVTLNFDGNPIVIDCIPQLVSVMICNLCDNAIKYNRNGGNVTVHIAKQSKEAVLTVMDTGIGIPKEHQERIFERFYRVDKSHSKEVGGTGLGLSIVKHAARIHGAKLNLYSIPDEGTTITVSFPITKTS